MGNSRSERRKIISNTKENRTELHRERERERVDNLIKPWIYLCLKLENQRHLPII